MGVISLCGIRPVYPRSSGADVRPSGLREPPVNALSNYSDFNSPIRDEPGHRVKSLLFRQITANSHPITMSRVP